MAIYRFKVFIEDNDDVYRDIDIRASQSFEEFHIAIQEAFKFDAKHSASFFLSDDYWRKGQEITLKKEDLPLDEEEIRKNVEPKKLMKDTKIARYIEQPHQRFVYVFDPNAQWTFLIEMTKIAEENKKLDYPAVTKSIGNPPKQYKQIALPKEELSPDLALAGLLNDEEPEEEEILSTIDPVVEAVEDDDISSLEGEEGEEESLDADEEEGDFEASEEED